MKRDVRLYLDDIAEAIATEDYGRHLDHLRKIAPK